MAHKYSTVVFSQGWLDGQFENMIAVATANQETDPTQLVLASQIQEQWNIVSTAVDELIRENDAMKTRLAIIESALK